ncbi:MAG: hypothetical protein VW371_03020 [Bacteroidota bacterium]
MNNFIIVFCFVFFSTNIYSQKIGYEFRSNGKAYISTSYAGFEVRHRTDKEENRFTYRYKILDTEKLTFSLPLHYKVEKEIATFEPRLKYHIKKFSLWAQKEFNLEENMNAAFGIDIPINDFTYRIGWDSSDTVRFRLVKKF